MHFDYDDIVFQISNLNETVLNTEQQTLLDTEDLLLIDYIKTSIEILLNIKCDQNYGSTKDRGGADRDPTTKGDSVNKGAYQSVDSNNSCLSSMQSFQRESCPKMFEEIIQKLESDIRLHIRMEQQMKIAMENLQQKLEDKEKSTKKHYQVCYEKN